jgi:hypothetical protein
MFRIINFASLIRYVAIATTFISIFSYQALVEYWDESLPLLKTVSIATWVSLAIVLIILTNFTARYIWKALRLFDSSLFPDLNGTWDGEITTESGMQIPAKAVIKQTLLQTWISIHTETSKSLTLETTPTTESGQCKLYYTYRSFPKRTDWQTYVGTTIFDVRILKDGKKHVLELSGHYFTDRKSNGRVRLRQVSDDSNSDVSFY